MRKLIGAVALSLAVTGLYPAFADTKGGVDAWNRGDYKGAVDQWRQAALAGDPDAQFNLGQAYKLGRGVPVDMAMAESWYRKAALQGHVQAEDNYGLILFQGGKRADALPWLEKSVARGEPRAQLVLGTMLFNGDGVQRDWVRAYALMVRSSAAGLPQGSQTLAEMDKYIPADQRQQGITLAKQYEQQAGRPDYAPEVAGGDPVDAGKGVRGADVPPSRYASSGASYPPPVTIAPPAPAPSPTPKPIKTPPPKVAATPSIETPPRAPRPAPIAVDGGWRVQFGAFRDEGNARNLWAELKGKVSALAGLQPYLRRTGVVTKLQAGPLASQAEAAKLCGAVKRAGSDCVPVQP